VGRLAAATVGLYVNIMGLQSFALAVAAVPYNSIGKNAGSGMLAWVTRSETDCAYHATARLYAVMLCIPHLNVTFA